MGASKRGEAPLSKNHPLSFEGEGDNKEGWGG